MEYSCGCKFDKLDWDSINLECPATWEMIGQGLTKGVFQLEGSLGRRWSKKIKPRNIEELSDVISLIRPGCLEAEYREDPKTGKVLSITDTYVKVKSKELEPEYIHESLEPILKSTQGVPIYQEQIMEICKDFAGFSLQEADDARKAVGKKIAELMAKVEEKFVAGALKNGHNEAIAKTIFGWIDKFSGYGFNKSHGVAYALIGYMTAYAKVHFPVEFFKNMLAFSDSKQDEFGEIKELVNEAKLFGIKVLPPSIKRLNEDFSFTDEGNLAFGLSHIKNVGVASIGQLKQLSSIKDEEELLSGIFTNKLKVKSNVIEALIKSGALDEIIDRRVDTLKKYRMLNSLTKREALHIVEAGIVKDEKLWFPYLVDNSIPRPLQKRIPLILEQWDIIEKQLAGNRVRMNIAYEKAYLGMAITGSETELYYNPKVNTTCRDFLRLKTGTRVTVGVLIEDVRRIKDKKGNPMCFMKVSDNTYIINDVVVFASVFNKVSWIIEPDKVVLISGKKSDSSLLVDSIEHL